MKALDAAKRIIKIKPIVISICIIAALIVGYFGYQYVSSHQKEGMVSTISESSLEKVIEISTEMHIAKLIGRVCGAKRPYSVSKQPIYRV